MYFILAPGLFKYVGARLVWGKLIAGLAVRVPGPSEKALRDLRRRIGATPLKQLFEVLAGPLAQPSTPGVCYRRWRTVAFDGCSNLAWLRRFTNWFGEVAYPKLMLMTLCETGRRGLLGACFGPVDQGEIAYARRLVGSPHRRHAGPGRPRLRQQ
ncbi:transposase domain-containing protein [Kitasatospora sp. NPDC057015]|uniref:transposase domain-containing protein n=1 Tax=Kitasatospora sp. NPDC057015 TaxID=3346001 RepID=UPI003629DA57